MKLLDDAKQLRIAAPHMVLESISRDALRAADECERGARAAATCARMGIQFPGENAATLQLFNVMPEPTSVVDVEAGRCC